MDCHPSKKTQLYTNVSLHASNIKTEQRLESRLLRVTNMSSIRTGTTLLKHAIRCGMEVCPSIVTFLNQTRLVAV